MAKSRGYPRGGARGRRTLSKSTKKEVAKVAKRVIDSRVETKVFLPTRVTDTEFDLVNPIVVSLLNVPQGTNDNQRVGDEFLYKHLLVNLDIRGSIDGAVKSGRPVDRIRVMLVKWKEPDYVNGLVNEPSALRIFGNQLPIGTNIFTAMPDHENNGRTFKILYDKKLTLCGDITQMSNCDSPEKKQTHLSIKVPQSKYGHQKVKYDSITPANNAHINGLYLMIFTDNPGGLTTSGPTYSMDARLLFSEC